MYILIYSTIVLYLKKNISICRILFFNLFTYFNIFDIFNNHNTNYNTKTLMQTITQELSKPPNNQEINRLLREVKAQIQPEFDREINLRLKDTEDQYHCSLCSRTFSTRTGLNLHLRKSHPQKCNSNLYLSAHKISTTRYRYLYFILEEKQGFAYKNKTVHKIKLDTYQQSRRPPPRTHKKDKLFSIIDKNKIEITYPKDLSNKSINELLRQVKKSLEAQLGRKIIIRLKKTSRRVPCPYCERTFKSSRAKKVHIYQSHPTNHDSYDTPLSLATHKLQTTKGTFLYFILEHKDGSHYESKTILRFPAE